MVVRASRQTANLWRCELPGGLAAAPGAQGCPQICGYCLALPFHSQAPRMPGSLRTGRWAQDGEPRTTCDALETGALPGASAVMSSRKSEPGRTNLCSLICFGGSSKL